MTTQAQAITPTPLGIEFTAKLPWLALLPLALIPLLGTNSGTLNNLLIATELLLMAAGVRRPVWVVGALLLNELTAANLMHQVGGGEISNRLILVMISLPIVAPHIAERFDIGRKALGTVLLGLGFVFLTTFANGVYSSEGYTIQFLRFIGLGFYLMILIPVAVKDRDDLRDLSVLLLGIGALVAVASIFQHYSESRGTPVWQVLPEAGPGTDTFESWQSRAIGLSANPILSGNALMMVLLFAVGVLLVMPAPTSTKRAIAVIALMMLGAGYFTYTRSWMAALGPAIVSMAVLYRGAYRKEFWILIVVLAAGFWYWSDMNSTRYTLTAEQDGSAAARPVLSTLAFDIASDNPWLGVGHDQFLELSPTYARTLDPDLLSRQGARDVVGVYTPHNDLLNVWLSWGFFALLIYVVFSAVIGWNFYLAFAASADPFLRGMAMGGLAALIGYQANALFHNFLDATLALWVLGGISLLLLKLGEQAPRSLLKREEKTEGTA